MVTQRFPHKLFPCSTKVFPQTEISLNDVPHKIVNGEMYVGGYVAGTSGHPILKFTKHSLLNNCI